MMYGEASVHSFSKPIRVFLDALLILIFLTTSFDTALNLKIEGFSIRLCSLLMVLFSALTLPLSLFGRGSVSIRFLGFWSFLIWFLFILFFIQNSILITRGIGYAIWLTIFFVFMIALANYVQSLAHFEKILIRYIHSFTLIGLLAIVQFFLTIAGVESGIAYFFRSGIPRIHGFSYEPSYFSTYLFVPWSFHFLLFFSDCTDFKKKIFNPLSLFILTLVLFMSFSRMGILAMILLAMGQVLRAVRQAVFNQKIRVRQFLFVLLFAFATLIIFFFAVFNWDTFLSLFEGLPFLSRYWHSATIRIDDFLNTWKIFIDSPFAGYSLGGIAPAIAQLKGYGHVTQAIVKHTEGMCIFLEVLAASGIIGFVFFMMFLVKLLRSSTLLRALSAGTNKPVLSFQFLTLHRILLLALIFQLLLLCLNQNILRNYLWTQIAMVNLSFFIIKHQLQTSQTAHGE